MAAKHHTVFSNSGAALAQDYTYDDSQLSYWGIDLNVLAGDPGSASLFSIGTTVTSTTMQGNVAVPTDLLTQDGVGYTTTSAQGASLSIVDVNGVAEVRYGTQYADTLGAGVHGTDSFYYAIQMANGTISYNTVTLNLTGVAAYLAADQTGFVAAEQNWVAGDVTTPLQDAGDIVAYTASGNLTGITVTANGSEHGTLTFNTQVENGATTSLGSSGSLALTTGDATFDSSVADLGIHYIDNGRDAYHFTYATDEASIYATGAGYGQIAYTDTWSITTANGTEGSISDTAYGGIHAAQPVAFSIGSTDPDLGDLVPINVTFTDHDNNAALSATISGVPVEDALLYDGVALTPDGNGNYALTGAQLAGLASGSDTLALAINVGGSISLGIVVNNTESYTDASETDYLGNDALSPSSVTANGATVTYAGSTDGLGNYTHTASVDTSATTGSLAVDGPVSIGFTMNVGNLNNLEPLGVGSLHGNQSMGTMAASGDPDDSFTYALGSGSTTSPDGAVNFDTTAFRLTSSGQLWTGTSGVGPNTLYGGRYYLDVQATDSEGHQTSQVFVVQVDGDVSNSQDFSSWSLPVIAYTASGFDTLDASPAGTAVYGGSANDILVGGPGNDTLVGGRGAETLTGGGGNDTFAYAAVSDSFSATGSYDTITDFAGINQGGTDIIDLSAIAVSGNGGHYYGTTFGDLTGATSIGADSIGYVKNGDGSADLLVNPTSASISLGFGTPLIMRIHLDDVSSLSQSDFALGSHSFI